ncbi:MAG: NAD(+) synthase [Clostridiales bacterium]|jgi:NAD+ synthase (glutamine-hydrolysing)|nr:NAD(+) synthase [Clostridiales bacterium]
MKHGFVKVAAATPKIKVADCQYNAERIKELIIEAQKSGADILVLPELCVTGYTCGDLFYQSVLLDGARAAVLDIREFTKTKKASDILVFLGLPLMYNNRLYNAAAAIKDGEILGFVPKTYLPNYNEFYDKRQFSGGGAIDAVIDFGGAQTPFSSKLLFECKNMPQLKVAAEICEDLWVMSPPSAEHAKAGAVVIVNLSASNETVGKAEYRRSLVAGQSGRLFSAYVYASAGDGESTSDIVFGGHNIIAENGRILEETRLFENRLIMSETDIFMLNAERAKFSNYDEEKERTAKYKSVLFEIKKRETKLTREYDRQPFVPKDKEQLERRAELILNMQAHALKKRLGDGFKAVVGVSGGLDSTLALLVTVRAFGLLKRRLRDIIGITMPCFGTTERTYNNSLALMDAIGVCAESVDISESVKKHLKDIDRFHEPELMDEAYENAQARERTQVLMDVANSVGGIVIGTGDLSEAALGWCTYNGDHMSMYAVNSSVPKTLVKYLVEYEAQRLGGKAAEVIREILSTPISPELLPPSKGEIFQKTEDIVGPYELHDFFLYYTVRFAYPPDKVFRLARRAFLGAYEEDVIKAWLNVFVKRFFKNQFKRNCVPDGVKIGSVSLSPRGDWRMPSDAEAALWLENLRDM